MDVKFKIDIKNVKQAFALIGEEIPSDKVIKQKFENIVVDLTNATDEDSRHSLLGFTLLAIATAFDPEKK